MPGLHLTEAQMLRKKMVWPDVFRVGCAQLRNGVQLYDDNNCMNPTIGGTAGLEGPAVGLEATGLVLTSSLEAAQGFHGITGSCCDRGTYES